MLITRRHIDISLPNENIKLRPDLAKQVVAEARRLQRSFPIDFLLRISPEKKIEVNGYSVHFPYLCALFSKFLNEETALVFSIKDPFMFEEFIKEVIYCLPNEKTKLLLKYGIRAVQSTTTDIKLDGGSFSEVTLFLYKNKRWRIKKETNSNYNGDIDAGVRLREEAYFLTSLPKEARHLFPKVYGENSVSKSSRIGYEMEYFPYQ